MFKFDKNTSPTNKLPRNILFLVLTFTFIFLTEELKAYCQSYCCSLDKYYNKLCV